MKMKHRALSIILSLAIMLTFMPAFTFAGSTDSDKAEAKKAVISQLQEKRAPAKDDTKNETAKTNDGKVRSLDYDDDYDYIEFDAYYSGRPTFSTYDYTEDDGRLQYDFQLEPNAGDSITVDTDEGKKKYVCVDYGDGDFFFDNPVDSSDWLYLYSPEVPDNNTEANIYANHMVWDEAEEDYFSDWSARVIINRYSIINTVSKIVFTPASINLVAENIIDYDEGLPYYSFWKRSNHNQNGITWTSPYAVGDKLTVYYTNGITQTFTNKNLTLYDEEEGSYYYDDYFTNGDYYFWLSTNGDELTLGKNSLNLSWHGVKTVINVTVETAAQKAAREKAEAERIAREKAAAAALARMKNTTTVTINTSTVNAATINNAIVAAGGSKDYVTKFVIGKKVKKISKKAFKGTKIKTLEVKSKKLKAKSVKGALKGSKVKTIKVKVGKAKDNKKYKAIYKTIFTKKIVGKKVKIR